MKYYNSWNIIIHDFLKNLNKKLFSSWIFAGPSRLCVCGTIDYQGHVEHLDESLAKHKLSKSEFGEMCKPFNDSQSFHKNILQCDDDDKIQNDNGSHLSHVCKLGSCLTDGYCFKWIYKEDGGIITTTFG